MSTEDNKRVMAPGMRVCDISEHFIAEVLECRDDCFVISRDNLCIKWEAVFTIEGNRVNLICDARSLKRYALP